MAPAARASGFAQLAGDGALGTFAKAAPTLQRRTLAGLCAIHSKLREQIDLRREGIRSIVWACGYRPDFEPLHIPVFVVTG